MSKEYVQMVGRMAYLWGWPLINSSQPRHRLFQGARARLARRRRPGRIQPNAMLTGYISPDEHFVTCPKPGRGLWSWILSALDKEPIVIQVPDSAIRFWVYALYDARTDEFSAIGKAYGTKPASI
jgi:hypothetical protein